MPIPATKREELKEEIHGISVSDPYRWLENPDHPEVKDWIAEQNAWTDSHLRNETQKMFSEELARSFHVVNFSSPVPVNGRYFFTERQPGQDQMVLFVKNGLEDEPTELINPNAIGTTTTLDFWMPSSTGRFVAYGLSSGGDEIATLRVMDVETKQDLPDTIAPCRYASITWLPDDSGFFYTRGPKPGTVPDNEITLHNKLYFHVLGADPQTDMMVFGEGRPMDDMIQLSMSVDGNLLAIHVARTWTHNEIYLYDIKQKTLSPLIVNIPAQFILEFLNDKVIVKTNYLADRYRVLTTHLNDLFKPLDGWEEFIPQRDSVLESVHVTKDQILLSYLVNVCGQIVTLDHNGRETGTIPLPAFTTITDISSRIEEAEFFYGIASFTFPKKIYRFDATRKQYDLYRATDNPISPENYVATQQWCVSKDGTKIPYFLFHKKDVELNGKNPTLLYGYGGFASSVLPMFMRQWIPWLERGGVFVVANIRGGGEFGESWHTQGIKDRKQNGYDDFIAVGEQLVVDQVTDSSHLGIIGGSNGGLLVSAVAVQRPDLFESVCSMVPLTDMVRFPKFGMAMRWVHEYGNPEIKNDLEQILKWSPYHNVKSDVEYPNILFTTANKDTRVDPLHARKMAAALQAVNQKNVVLIFSEEEAGHGPGKPISKYVEAQSLILTFFAQTLGLK
ncbi:MAG: prolyl oligopeptidase family serine peptidase [Patescibacteria group bacterium]